MSKSDERYAEMYGQLCDVVERAWQHWPVNSHKHDACRHTSDYARAAARRILDIISTYGAAEAAADRNPERQERIQ